MVSNAIKVILQEKELILLKFLAKFGVINQKHVMQLLEIDAMDMNKYLRIIRRLSVANYIKKHRLIVGQTSYITLGKLGAKLLAAKQIKQLNLNTLTHDMLVLDIYFEVMAKQSTFQVLSEKELRSLAGLKVGDKKKVPDLLIDQTVAIEVELSEKSITRLVEIISNYIHDLTLKEVWYFVKSRLLGQKILNLAGNHQKIKVFLLNFNSANLEYIQLNNDQFNNQFFCQVTTPSATSFDLNAYLAKE